MHNYMHIHIIYRYTNNAKHTYKYECITKCTYKYELQCENTQEEAPRHQ